MRDKKLQESIEQQSRQINRSQREHDSIWAQSIYLSTLGLIFVLPIVAGAYLGHWIDNQLSGYSTRWTISLILTGVMIGAINVYLFIKE